MTTLLCNVMSWCHMLSIRLYKTWMLYFMYAEGLDTLLCSSGGETRLLLALLYVRIRLKQ